MSDGGMHVRRFMHVICECVGCESVQCAAEGCACDLRV